MSGFMENGGKKVVVSVSTMNLDGLTESLRMAIGIATGRNPLQIAVLLSGDGVVNALEARKNDDFSKYYLAAKAHDISLYVDEFCMSLRGLEADHILKGIQIVKREEILALLSSADLHVRL